MSIRIIQITVGLYAQFVAVEIRVLTTYECTRERSSCIAPNYFVRTLRR